MYNTRPTGAVLVTHTYLILRLDFWPDHISVVITQNSDRDNICRKSTKQYCY